MRSKLRLIVVTTLATLGVAVSVAALAWACTPQAYIGLNPSSGRAGTAVTVTGRGFVPGAVEVRWGGTVLATATGPDFSVGVHVPASATPGVHYVEAVTAATGAGGGAIGRATRAFRVTAAPATPPVSSPTQGNARVPQQQPAASGRAGAPTAAAPAKRAASRAEGRRAVRADSRGLAQRPASQTSAAVNSRSESAVFDSARGDAAQGTTAGARARGATGTAIGHAAAADPDMWGGFADGRAPSLTAAADVPDSGSSTSLRLGVGLLGAGLLALVAGITAAEVRRRREV